MRGSQRYRGRRVGYDVRKPGDQHRDEVITPDQRPAYRPRETRQCLQARIKVNGCKAQGKGLAARIRDYIGSDVLSRVG